MKWPPKTDARFGELLNILNLSPNISLQSNRPIFLQHPRVPKGPLAILLIGSDYHCGLGHTSHSGCQIHPAAAGPTLLNKRQAWCQIPYPECLKHIEE